MGWKRYCENFAIAISLTQIFIVVLCSHISPLFYSPLAEEWRNYIGEAIYHWRWCVSCQSVCCTNLKWPLTFPSPHDLDDLWPFSTWPLTSPHVLNDLWPFILHMAVRDNWDKICDMSRPLYHTSNQGTIILPHFERTFDDMKKQPLSWLLGKWSSISRTVAWNWTFACRGLWGLGGYLVLVRALVLEPVAPGLIWFWGNLGF